MVLAVADPRLRSWRCPKCNRLTCRCHLEQGSVVERKCDNCNHLFYIVASGGTVTLHESLRGGGNGIAPVR